MSKILKAASIRVAIPNISGATIHKALNIDRCIKNQKKRTVKGQWQYCFTFIIDKISIISLKLLFTVDF